MSAVAIPSHSPSERGFSDWWNPMWVKECRQGLRNTWFVVLFIWIQLSLAFLVAMGVLARLLGSTVELWEFAFWADMVLVLHVAPLVKGLVMRDEDHHPQRLGLLRLAGMTNEKLVMNKYKVLVVQSLLIVTTVLPCCLVRYFAGGVNIMEDLQKLAWLMLGALLLNSLSVLLATLSVSGRIAAALILLIGFPFFEGLLWAAALTSAFGQHAEALSMAMLWFICGGIMWMMCLSIAAANYSSVRE